MKQHFFVGQEYLGCRGIPHTWTPIAHEGKRVIASHHYFCSHCGEVWGRLLHDMPGAHNQVTIRPCLRHAHGGWGGNLSSPATWGEEIPTAFARDWPDAAVRWEFRVNLHHWERELERETA